MISPEIFGQLKFSEKNCQTFWLSKFLVIMILVFWKRHFSRVSRKIAVIYSWSIVSSVHCLFADMLPNLICYGTTHLIVRSRSVYITLSINIAFLLFFSLRLPVPTSVSLFLSFPQSVCTLHTFFLALSLFFSASFRSFLSVSWRSFLPLSQYPYNLFLPLLSLSVF